MGEALLKIGQAAEAVGVKPFVLRFWEGEFPQLEPVRTESGQRLYTAEHVELVRRIKYLLHERKLTIEGARQALEEQQRDAFWREVETELKDIRRLLLEKPDG